MDFSDFSAETGASSGSEMTILSPSGQHGAYQPHKGRRVRVNELESMRRRVVQLWQDGLVLVEIAGRLGLSYSGVFRTVERYRQTGEASFRPQKRGSKVGTGRALSTSQQERLRKVVLQSRPEDLGLAGRRWSGPSTCQLIHQLFGVELTERTAFNYLQRIQTSGWSGVDASRTAGQTGESAGQGGGT